MKFIVLPVVIQLPTLPADAFSVAATPIVPFCRVKALLMKCKNASSSGKRSRLFELCGQARTTASATRLDAYIPLNVPVLSAIANDKSKLPFDLIIL